METVEVYAVGCRVLLDGSIPAYITAISIRNDGVSYECNWWDERTKRTEWMTAQEFTLADVVPRTARIALRKV